MNRYLTIACIAIAALVLLWVCLVLRYRLYVCL
ncbi:hypothetical protein C4K20_5134 [Pseudomonas chlororaphis subsp. aurantiaca]|nr:hypothetical protein C4K20_5134 [Pseudomonas chlororaphis subsp. aurantiaca]